MRFKGKRALVTGAAGGIGLVLTESLRSQGAEIFTTDLHNSDLDGDVCDANFSDTLPSAAESALGGLDLVFNNAGVIRRGPVTESSDADWALTMGVNVEAPFRICRAAIPILERCGGGAIVNTSSCWGVHPGPAHALYCMSKAAIASLTQCMGRDHASAGIRVNAVCPNEVDTPMLRTGFEMRGFDPSSAIAELGKTVPIGHVATAQEIVDAMLFLASNEARYITGTLLEINGGKPVG